MVNERRAIRLAGDKSGAAILMARGSASYRNRRCVVTPVASLRSQQHFARAGLRIPPHGVYAMALVNVLPTALNELLMLLASELIAATQDNPMMAATRAYSTRSCPHSSLRKFTIALIVINSPSFFIASTYESD